jgi:hypothetical protein
MLHRVQPTTRLVLAALLLGWLLLQATLPALGREPAMHELARVLTILVAAAVLPCVWLLKTYFPDADVPPKKLEALLMIAAFGFATALLLRSLRKSSPADAAAGAAGA